MSAPLAPAWAREIAQLLPACSHFLLSGNTRDKFFVQNGAGQSAAGAARLFVPELLSGVLQQRSGTAVITFDMTTGADIVSLTEAERTRSLDTTRSALDDDLQAVAPAGDLDGLATLIDLIVGSAADLALIVKSASRLTLNIARLTPGEFTFWRRVDELSRNAVVPGARRAAGGRWVNPVIWLLDRERDVPEWFALNNIAVRPVVLPLPDTGQRERFARAMLPALFTPGSPTEGGGDAQPVDEHRLGRAVATFRDRTAGLPLTALERICTIARERAIRADEIDEAVDFYRTGVEENPWSSAYLTGRIRAELAGLGDEVPDHDPVDDDAPRDDPLVKRVLGQDRAVRKAVEILARSAMGLTAAQTGKAGTRPRGVMFLAGPTGVGKTELAKAVARLVFGDEGQLLRFDMSEFSAEQSADRLIGAPPGYVGFDAGGELTNGIRRQPFSVVLFDEIEKAHPLILDKFLQVLDDGRLTDGRGDTVHFTDAVIVFTTNLGMYVDVEVGRDARSTSSSSTSTSSSRGMYVDVEVGRDAARTPVMRRMVNEEARSGSPAQREAAIRKAIQDHFITKLGRPELLNRIGMDNIVVFDFIDKTTGALILDVMVGRVRERVRDQHELELAIAPEAAAVITSECLTEDVLDFGGRGIGSRLETVLVNPLATALLLQPKSAEAAVTLAALSESGGTWRASLR